MEIYEELGIQPVINAAGTYTVWGGSCMSKETLAAMSDAAECFVSIRDLQRIVHGKLAKLTKNEGAYVSNGAATGLYLAVAACIEKKAGLPYYYLKKTEIEKYNVAVFRSHRNPYDLVIQHLGVEYQEIGFPNIILPATERDIEQAINEHTAAFYYANSTWTAPGANSLEVVVKICKKHNIPVIVDAAAQLPPKENLWKFTAEGASLVLFSGGKDLKGPQSSGLIVGNKELIDTITSIGFPNYGIGRMMKVGREELIGLYAAVKQYIESDEMARRTWCDLQVEKILTALKDIPRVQAEYSFPNEAGQPIPRARLSITQGNLNAKKMYESLLDESPRVLTGLEEDVLYINPMTLKEGETDYIIEQILKILRRSGYVK